MIAVLSMAVMAATFTAFLPSLVRYVRAGHPLDGYAGALCLFALAWVIGVSRLVFDPGNLTLRDAAVAFSVVVGLFALNLAYRGWLSRRDT